MQFSSYFNWRMEELFKFLNKGQNLADFNFFNTTLSADQ